MIKYNKDNKACDLLNTFTMNGRLLARVKEIYTEKVIVIPYSDFVTGDFSFEEKPMTIADMLPTSPTLVNLKVVEPVKAELVNDKDEVVLELEAIPMPVAEEVKSARVKATTPKGKIMYFNKDNMEDFCNKHKLDKEAVESVLEGSQKTHRKWGFVEVE